MSELLTLHDKAMDLAKRVHAVLPRAIKVRGINYMYAAVRVEGDGKKIDFIVPERCAIPLNASEI